MEDLLNPIIEYLVPKNDLFLYFFLFLSAVIENLFPPIPGDTITAFGAFLVGTERLDYFLVYLSTSVGSVVGFIMLFYFGRFLGKEFFLNKNYKYFPANKIHATEKWFLKYGYFVILLNRFFPGIRSVISIVSGISNLNPIKVFIYALISASIWNLIWIHTGYLLGNNWDVVKEQMKDILKQYNITLAIIVSITIIIILIYKKRNKKLT